MDGPAYFFHLKIDIGRGEEVLDWRFDIVLQTTVTMASRLNKNSNADEGAKGKKPTDPPTTVDAVTRGRWEPVSDTEDQRLGWGVVRLYRDAEETAGLYQVPTSNRKGPKSPSEIKDEDCTVLCILAVPSYLTPSDFLGFVGEKTRVAVSHFRMIRTERSNRYMVLMKFRHGKTAREWRSAWNGRSFDGMEVSPRTI